MNNKSSINPDIMLLMVAIIWGTGFIATEYAINSNLNPLQIIAGRFSIATLSLIPFVLKDIKSIHKTQWLKGSISGLFLFLGFFLQIAGQSMTTVSKSAFLTATNVVFVPFLAWMLTGKRPRSKIFILALFTFIGVAVLTLDYSSITNYNLGDFYVFLCAIAFACHIAYVSIAVKDNNPLPITFIQMLTASILAITGLLITGGTSSTNFNLISGIPSLIFLGLFSTSLCFFMQNSAQKRTTPGKAGIILSTESLFGTIFSIMMGFELLTAKIAVGGLIILTSVVLTEVDLKPRHIKSGAEL